MQAQEVKSWQFGYAHQLTGLSRTNPATDRTIIFNGD